MQLRLQEILAFLPSADYIYKITHPEGAFHFIEMPDIHPDSSPESLGAGSYLRNPTVADDAMARPMKATADGGSELSEEFLQAISNGQGVLLLEANAATDQSFELIISKKKGGEQIARIPRAVPVVIEDNPEHFYWHLNLRPAADGGTPGAVEPLQYADPSR